jgi:EAL domain-containing protein (putative c-di-GMP-specific phosphodiesterase class I)
MEVPAQLEVLRTLGCDLAQGNLFGCPLPPEAIGDHPADDLTAWQHPLGSDQAIISPPPYT